MISPKSRFRIISKLYRCEIVDRRNVNSDVLVLIPETEEVLGVYRGDTSAGDLVFTSEALYAREPETLRAKRVPFIDIREIEFPLPASESVRLNLKLANEKFFAFDVIGRVGTYRDVFEVGRFFMKIMEDIAKRSSDVSSLPKK